MRLYRPCALSAMLLWFAVSWLAATPARAEDFGPGQLPQRVPQTPAQQVAPPADPGFQLPPHYTGGSPEDTNILAAKLKGIVILNRREDVNVRGWTNMSVLVANGLYVDPAIALLQGEQFAKIPLLYLGLKWPFTTGDLKSLQNDIILFCRARNRPLVDVFLPEQIMDNGVIQLWFLESRVGKVTVANTNHHAWFSTNYMRHNIRLRGGDHVDIQKLNRDLDWLNRNPFRQVNTTFKPGDDLNETDLILRVEDRFPARVFAGYENSGTKFSGQDRFVTGLNYGNVFGLDHQLNYQYTADIEFKTLNAHSASYLIPLPWRHNLALLGAYAENNVDLGNNSGISKGTSYQGSARYSIPTRLTRNYLQEITLGFDYKNSDNDLEFGGNTTSPTRVDIDQFELGYSGLLLDRWGQTSFGLEGYYSPGGMTGNNHDANFEMLRKNSKANYGYVRLNIERITRLPHEFSWVVHAFGQYSSTRLPPSEEMGLGGYGSVRGYGERSFNGDDGWYINNELRSPPFSLVGWLFKRPQVDRFQVLVFFDYGQVFIKDFDPTVDTSTPDKPITEKTELASVGPGVRYSVLRNLTVRFDYGFQLINKENDKQSGPHVGVTLSY